MKYTQEQLNEILNKHKEWLYGNGGNWANLSDAYLSDAYLWGTVGNREQIRSISVSEKYAITYTQDVLQIGCERRLISEWQSFDDDAISNMDRGALEWWKENRDFIFMTIEKYPATPTGKE